MRHRLLLASLLTFCVAAWPESPAPPSKEYFVSPHGSPSGTGAASDPWDLATALAHPPAVQPGDTIWLRAGIYRGTFTSRLQGSPSRPILVRQYPGETTVIDAAGAIAGSALEAQGGWTWFWDFEVTAGRRATGVEVAATGTRFINLRVRNAATAFRLGPRASDTELYGNLIYDNGRAQEGSLDCGVLVEDGGPALIADNIIARNTGAGIRVIRNASLLIEGNAIFDNGRNLEIRSAGFDLVGNHTWSAGAGVPGAILGEGRCESARLAGNLFADGTVLARGCGDPGPVPAAGAVVRTRKNRYDPARHLLVIHNRDLSPVVAADADGALRPGDAYRIRRAGDDSGADLLRGVYDGKRLDLPMQGVSRPFEVFLLERLGVPRARASLGSIPRLDLKLWLRADQGVVVDESSVSRWVDQSGNGSDAMQSIPIHRPAFVARGLHGRPAVRFDGATDFMTLGSGALKPRGMTVVLVGGSDSASPTITTIVRSGGGDRIFVDGSRSAAGKRRPIDLDAPESLGRRDAASYFKGDLAEALVYHRALSDVERQSIELYLAEKYARLSAEPRPSATAGSVPSDSLKLWLRADAGVTQSGGKVSAWADQSETGTNAAQANSTSQPALLTSAVNGLPALEFDGINDFLTFTLDINNQSGMSVFLVSASTSTTQDGSWHGATQSPIFWNETGDWSTTHMSPYQRVVKFRFGTGQGNNLPVYTRPASIGSNFSVNSFVKNGATESLYIDGSLALTATGKLSTIRNTRTTGSLGRGYNDNTYFAGRIAEVLVYTRALSDAERQQVEAYLLGRYPAPPAVVNQPPTANAGADQTITIFDSATLNGSATDDQLPNGTLTYNWTIVGGPGTVSFANATAASTTATFSTTGAYVLRLTANDGALSGSDDLSITVNSPPPGAIPQQNLKLWLKADSGVSVASGKVSAWADQSGSGTNATQASTGSQPAFVASAFNGRPALQFDGIDDFLTFNLPLNGLTAMTIVLVSASTSSTQDGTWNGAANSAIFWNETSDWCTVSLSPYQRVIRYHFGTGQVNDLPSYTRPVTIGATYSMTTVIKNGANEALYVNGAQVYTAGGKLTTLRNVNSTGNLGRGYNNNTYFAGQIAEALVYTKALNDAERQSLEQYLLEKYPPVQPATNQAPSVSAGADQTISLFQSANLNGSAGDDGLPGGGLTTTWSMISGPGTVTFGNSTAAATTASFSAAGVYTLRLTANDTALSASDDVIVTVNSPPPGSIPQQDLKLWLKADAGVTAASGKVSAWADQSGSGANAAQASSASQPALLTNAVNGLPALEFDGLDDFLTFAMNINNLSGMSVFLVSASTSSTQDGSWHGATQSPIFWNETGDWSTTHMSPYQRVVKFRFGTGQGNNLPVYTRPASIGSNFSVNAFVKNGATESLYIDGSLALTATGKLSAIRNTRTTGNLGRGYNDNTYFAGRIAEVLVYTRALSDAERQSVEQYLLQRYPSTIPVNQAPQVNAGSDQSLAYPSGASLSGTVTDDDLPNGSVTTLWSKVSGPGTVTFASASSKSTTATFSAAGVYVLRLTANDGVLSGSDDVTITLNIPPPDTTPTAITNVQVASVFSTSATITWHTDEPADSQVFYGTSARYTSSTTLDTAKVLDHSVTVNGLQPNTTWHFSVRSADAAGNASTSPDGSFTTPPASLITDGLVGHYSMAQAAGRPTGLNDLQHAEDFENWIVWERAAAVTPNVAAAPDGTMTADKVALTAPRGLLYHPFVAAAPGQTYTFSIYMRTLSGTYDLRLVRDNTDCWCGTPSPTLTVTETWQRFSLTFPVAATERASSVGFGFEEITPWNLPVSGEVLVWGAQLEPGSSPTPYPALSGFTMRDQAVPDLSGRNNHGWLGATANGPDFTLTPGSVWAQHDPARQTQSIWWDGAYRWVQVPNSADLNLTTKGAWTVLAKPDANWKEWAAFFNRATGPGNGTQYAIVRYSTTNQISFYTGNDNHPYRGGNLPMGVWSVVTVTLDSGVLVGYIDGAEIFRFTNVPALRSISTDLKIGTFNVPPAYNYRGEIGAVLFYNRALTPGEVAQNAAILKAGLN